MCIVITSQVNLDDVDTRSNHILGLFENISKISETYLFVPTVKTNKEKTSLINYVPYLNFPILKIISYEILLFFRLLLFDNNKKIDAIYNRQSPCTVFPLFLSKILGVPFFVEVNGSLLAEGQINENAKLLGIVKISEKLNYNYASRIIAVSEGIKQDLMELYGLPASKINVIENGTDTELFYPIDKNELELDFDKKYKYVGFIGSFAPWHGLEHLIRSTPYIVKEYAEVRFILVGDGALKGKILDLIKDLHLEDYFLLTGRVHHSNIPEYINMFDICTIFKDKDIPGSPLKLYEYLACGKPVVATNSPDFSILERFELGLLVNPYDSKEVSSSIVNLLKDDNLRDKMGINGRKYAVDKGSWMHVATEVHNIISEYVT